MSEQIRDPTAGINGSFEVAQSGLPVNWMIFSPATVPEGDFDVGIDTTEHVAGNQSLKFAVRACAATGGSKSPGIVQEYTAERGDIFTVSCQVKNDGAQFQMGIGGVSAFGSHVGPSVRMDSTISQWRLYEWEYELPENMDRLRFGVSITKPGTLWIDDVRITRSSGLPVTPL
ncbi:MAG: hypothetical protein HOH74_25845 [Gemmatimonadetes bacterium]|nr:hypothetical protein [Gemmatimonadota bacterium]